MNDQPRYDVVIIGGFGHVGLPLGIVFADNGLPVALLDIDVSKRPLIEAGKMPFIEYGAEPILQRVIGKTLHIADDLSAIATARYVIITVGTPVDEYLNPETRPIFELAESIARYLRPDHCVVLRSTVFPGTSQALYDFLMKRVPEVQVAYCPERIVQGHAIRELRKLPQVVSGFTDAAIASAEALFGRLGVRSIRVSVQEAELTKLFSNAWRYLQFAITNQFYMMAQEYGADYDQIYRAMTYDYSRAKDFPRPGFAAGPCLLKDTLQLAAFYQNHFQLGHAAMMINEGLPNFVVKHLRDSAGGDLNGTTVGILGMAFKADIDDIRDSLSYKLLKILRFHGATVLCSDEYVSDPTFVSKEDLLAKADVVIVGVPHSAYRSLTIPERVRVIDLWGALGADRAAALIAETAPAGRSSS